MKKIESQETTVERVTAKETEHYKLAARGLCHYPTVQFSNGPEGPVDRACPKQGVNHKFASMNYKQTNDILQLDSRKYLICTLRIFASMKSLHVPDDDVFLI